MIEFQCWDTEDWICQFTIVLQLCWISLNDFECDLINCNSKITNQRIESKLRCQMTDIRLTPQSSQCEADLSAENTSLTKNAESILSKRSKHPHKRGNSC